MVMKLMKKKQKERDHDLVKFLGHANTFKCYLFFRNWIFLIGARFLLKFKYRCSECLASFDITPDLMLCPKCSINQKEDQPLIGVLETECSGSLPTSFDPIDFLPVERNFFPESPVGKTPLWKPKNLRENSQPLISLSRMIAQTLQVLLKIVPHFWLPPLQKSME